MEEVLRCCAVCVNGSTVGLQGKLEHYQYWLALDAFRETCSNDRCLGMAGWRDELSRRGVAGTMLSLLSCDGRRTKKTEKVILREGIRQSDEVVLLKGETLVLKWV